ncbi:hypothetical protein BLNAU_17717 [Blattamonas nauphoetae]|uniref:Uncharacterized protein n=1 Tax=Blattamonas nauphoetae TaxID=2049346 RepID=A0ABQ9X6C8_9EUKA|nr:hypothetical protein BLNAU_17717 [Blattamonas nauphoetae]
MSGGYCSPFVVDSQSGCDGSSISFVSCCHEPSTQNQLFPLVDFDSRTNPSFPTSMNADNDLTTHSAAGTVSVTCVNHLMSDADLPLGTGPLLNFARISEEPHTPSSLNVETSLSHSRLLNVSSSPSPALRQHDSIGQSQKMIGVEVSGCTNHLYGTACDDMNNGGSILCLNSSFSRCSTSLSPSSTHPTYTLQHRTGSEQRITLPDKDSSSVSFSHCTFHTMTSTLSGAAISQPVSISASVFSGCYAQSYGASIYTANTQSTSLSDCCFDSMGIELKPESVIEISTPTGGNQISHCLFHKLNVAFRAVLYLSTISSINISFSSFIAGNGTFLQIYTATSTVNVLNCEFIETTGKRAGGVLFEKSNTNRRAIGGGESKTTNTLPSTLTFAVTLKLPPTSSPSSDADRVIAGTSIGSTFGMSVLSLEGESFSLTFSFPDVEIQHGT